MERIKVPASDVTRVLAEVVAERPDHVYAEPVPAPMSMTSCYYVHGAEDDRTPGCLVGHVLNRLGVPLDTLQQHEGESASDVAARTLIITGHPDETSAVYRVLDDAQSWQDLGETWGRALEIATLRRGE